MIPSISPAFHTLVSESPPEEIAFVANGREFTYKQLAHELERQSNVGIAYATQIMETLLMMLLDNQELPKRVAIVPVDIHTPRQCVIEQYQTFPPDTVVWKTMSKYYTANDMAAQLQQSDPDARSHLSSFVRVVRDIVARQSITASHHPNETPSF